MASLTGQSISTTYDSLLKLTDNGPITSSFKEITDGLGNSSGVFLISTGQIKLGNYTTTTSFTGTAAGYLAFTSSGEIITTANPGGGISSLNALTGTTQTFATGTTGSDFGISSVGTTHTFNIPTASATNRGALSSADWTTFNNKGNGTVTSVAALTLGTTGTDLSSSVANGTTTPVITLNVPTASATNRGVLSSTDWSTFNNKQSALTLTVTGSSGASTLVGSTLNIPTYTLAGLGGVPTSRTLTINGTTYDLSADRSWTIAGTGISTLNTLNASTQTFAVGTSGTDFAISSATSTHTFNLPTASATNRGALSSADWTTFNNKQATITGGATTITSSNLTASRALVSDGSGKVAVATTTSTEIGYVNGVTSAIQTQIDGKADKTSTFNIQTGTSYTLVLSDAGKIIEMQSGSANIVYIPLNSSVAFPIGTEIQVLQFGAGQTTITPVSGVTTKSKSNQVKIANTYTGVTLVKRGTNDWYIIGNLTA